MTTELRVERLSIGRGGQRLLSGVSFVVPPGQALSIQGRNGLGKTTLLRTLAGLSPPLAGNLRHDPEHVAYAAHSDGVKPSLTVGEMLRFWAALNGDAEIETALDAYGLRGIADRAGALLSAGQRRRVALARVALSGRAIWCLDEPTAGLDAEGQAQLAQALTRHLTGGGLAILVTHGAPPIPCADLTLDTFADRGASEAWDYDEAVT